MLNSRKLSTIAMVGVTLTSRTCDVGPRAAPLGGAQK
jgi:hypothetical protein